MTFSNLCLTEIKGRDLNVLKNTFEMGMEVFVS